jgi:hypothetical protein
VCFLAYAIRKFQAKQEGLKLNDTHQLLVYAGDANTLRGSRHTMKRNTEALAIAITEIGIEANVDKTKYMVMSQDQNAGQNRNINIDNKSLERVEKFKYLGTTLTNRNFIHEEIKIRLMSGNACYHSVQNLFCSSLLPKNIKMKIYRTVVLPVIVLYGCETWSLTLREEHRLRVFENRVLRKIFVPKRGEVTWEWKRLLWICTPRQTRIIRVSKSRMRWVGHVARIQRGAVYTGFWLEKLRESHLEDQA